MTASISRRSFVGSASATALATVALGASAAAPAAARAETVDWLGVEPQIDEAQIAETLECDILVVGDGDGGAFAAGAAAEAGVSVIVIEKNSQAFGIRGGLGAVGSRTQAANGVEIDKVALMDSISSVQSLDMDMNLMRAWVNNSGEAIDWLTDVLEAVGGGMTNRTYVCAGDVKYRDYATSHGCVVPEGYENSAAVVHEYVENAGGQYFYNTAMVKLEKTDGRVTGVIATNEAGDYIRINAAMGVIVCTGGYSNNLDMMGALQPQTLKAAGLPGLAAHMMGDGVKACIWAGAQFDDIHASCTFNRAALPPDGVAGPDSFKDGFYFLMGSQPFLKVNTRGERFYNESGLYDFMAHALAFQPGGVCAMVWDANFEDQMAQFDTMGCSRVYNWPDTGLPSGAGGIALIQAQLETVEADGYMQKADTLEELAEKLNIPADTFVATVERYNELCEKGVDEDFGKEAFRMAPLAEPPYCGIRLTAYPMCTNDGIRTDVNANAVDENFDPIPGLYVAGNDQSSFFVHSYYDLVPGLTAMFAGTFARLAVKHAVSQA